MKPKFHKVQIARRLVQFGVVGLLLLSPAIARYHNYVAANELDRVLESWQGKLPGAILGGIDRAFRVLPGGEAERAGTMVRDREKALERAQQFRGSVWSAEVGPLSMTDPLAAAESVVATKRFPWVLAVSLAVPVFVTLLLGRVFCSWICPMGLLLEFNDKLRRVLRFLELHPRNMMVSRGTKYGLLVAGLVLAAALAVPVLGYIYPPAILGRELHDLMFQVFDRAELGRFGLWPGGISWMFLLIVGVALIELTVSRRWWCRYVCPGGALYSLIGWARPVHVELRTESCTECAKCVAACPMGLNPMRGKMGIECDNCGVCIAACRDDALGFALRGIGAGASAGVGDTGAAEVSR